jgi:hypothetical protein
MLNDGLLLNSLSGHWLLLACRYGTAAKSHLGSVRKGDEVAANFVPKYGIDVEQANRASRYYSCG